PARDPMGSGGRRMKTASVSPPLLVEPIGETTAWVDLRSRLGAFVALTKPRITLMVLVTVAVGYWLGCRGAWRPATLWLTILGTGLVAGGASACNQVLERARDARMRRTANRPLVLGRLAAPEAAVFGTSLALMGLALLAVGANLLAAWTAL